MEAHKLIRSYYSVSSDTGGLNWHSSNKDGKIDESEQ